MRKSKVAVALEAMAANPDLSQNQAAAIAGTSQASVSRALQRARKKYGEAAYRKEKVPEFRTKRALEILAADPDRPLSSIAAELGIRTETIYIAIKTQKETAHLRCSHCGSLLPYLKRILKEEK